MSTQPAAEPLPNADASMGTSPDGAVARRFHTALLELAKNHHQDFDAALREILKTAAETLQVARVCASFFAGEGMVCRELYQLSGGFTGGGDWLDAATHPRYFRALEESRVIAAHDALTHPDTVEFAQGYLQGLGVGAMLDVPIWQRGKVVGVLCHEHVGGPRQWLPEEQDFAASVSDMISLAAEAAERAEAEVLKSAIVANALDCIISIDAEGCVVEFNPAAERTFGYTRQETLGREMAELIVPPSLREAHRQGLARCLATGQGRILGQRIEVMAMRADGTEFPVELAITETRIANRVLFSAYLRDISARRELEESLRALNVELEDRVKARTNELVDSNLKLLETQEQLAEALRAEQELGELRSNFVSTVSHEFRTPLGIILSSAEILEAHYARLDDAEREEHLHTIHDAVRNMSELMEEVLVFHKLGAAADSWEQSALDLYALCHRLTDETLSSTARRCAIRCEVAALPAVRGNEKLIRHILINLLTNAVKYSPDGCAVALKVTSQSGMVEFQVSDRGIGIPAKDLEHLFEPFRRGSNVGTRAGTGLGLTIAKKCAELHGGSISVESREGEGTSFTVHLPLLAPA